MDADLRYATTDEERAAVYRLRYEIYVEGQGLFQDDADHERRWLTDEDDACSTIVLAEIDGEVVGTIRLTWGSATKLSDADRKAYDVERFEGVVDERDVILVSRLVLRPELRGGTLGCQIFCKVFEFAAEHNAELILGTCETHLLSHYRKLGFRPFGALYNHPTNGVLVPIVAVTGDFEYLRQNDAMTLGVLSRRTRPTVHLEQILARVHEGLAIVSQELEEAQHYRSEVTRGLAGAEQGLCGILGELSSEEADALLARSYVLTCRADDALILKGHVSRTLYMLLSGTLEVREDGEVIAGVDQSGALVGEVAMLMSDSRMSDVVAGPGGARVLALSYGNLRRIIAGDGPLAKKLLHFMARGLCKKLKQRAQAPTGSGHVDRVTGDIVPVSRENQQDRAVRYGWPAASMRRTSSGTPGRFAQESSQRRRRRFA